MTVTIYPSVNDVGGGQTIEEEFVARVVEGRLYSYGIYVDLSVDALDDVSLVAGSVLSIYGRIITTDADIDVDVSGVTADTLYYIVADLTIDGSGDASAFDLDVATSIPSDTATHKYLVVGVYENDGVSTVSHSACPSCAPGRFVEPASFGFDPFEDKLDSDDSSSWGTTPYKLLYPCSVVPAHDMIAVVHMTWSLYQNNGVTTALFPSVTLDTAAHLLSPTWSNSALGQSHLDLQNTFDHPVGSTFFFPLTAGTYYQIAAAGKASTTYTVLSRGASGNNVETSIVVMLKRA